MNLHAQLNLWLNRPVHIGFEETPPLEGRLVAVHIDYLTLVRRDRLLHCPLHHIGSLKRKLSAAARAQPKRRALRSDERRVALPRRHGSVSNGRASKARASSKRHRKRRLSQLSAVT